MSDYENLVNQVDSVMEDIEEFARQIESGECGNQWEIFNADGESVGMISGAGNEFDALQNFSATKYVTGEGRYAERVEFDVPTIVDENGNETSIDDWALSVEVKIGKPLQVWISFGGPNILIESSGYQNTRLAGHWGGQSVYRSGSAVEAVFDYFVEDLYDNAPEEYK